MKIVEIIGGLGNQMFQYSFFKSIENNYPQEKTLIDCSNFNGYPLHNGLELDSIFNIKLPQANFRELLSVTIPTYNYKLHSICKRLRLKRDNIYSEKSDSFFDKHVFKINKDTYFEGYWQNENYFHSISKNIINEFKFTDPKDDKNQEILNIIRGCNSVSIHIRRGDFLKHPIYTNICNLDYYKKAIEFLLTKLVNPIFFIFSNDTQWCKDNITPIIKNNKSFLIDWNTDKHSFIDMQLMSNCKNNIVANSSFSWWGAYLNQNDSKIVISPKIWLNKECGNIQLDSWIKI